MPADAGGIKKNLRAGETHEARAFWVPLVPTNLDADAAIARGETGKTEIAWREIKFLEVEWIFGDVHLAIAAGERAIGIDNRGGIVIDAGTAALKNGNDQDNSALARDGGEGIGGGAGNGFGEGEEIGLFFAAEILGTEKLGQADDLRAARGGIANFRGGAREIFFGVGGGTHLNQTHGKFIGHPASYYHAVLACGRAAAP